MEITINHFSQFKKPLQDSKALLKDSEEGRDKLKQMLLTCCAIYPTFGKEVNAIGITYQAYVELLGDYESGKVHEAFLKHISNETAFPTIAHIVKNIKEQRAKDAKSNRVDGMALIMENVYGK